MAVYKNDANLVALWLMEEASGATRLDDTANNNDLADNNTVNQSADEKEGTYSADFVAADYLSIADGSQTGLDLDAPFTILMWIKQDVAATRGIVQKDGAYEIIRKGSDGKLRLRLTANGSDYTDFDSDSALGTGAWVHIAVVADGTDVEWFQDGSSDNSSPGAWSSSVNDSANDFWLGRRDTEYWDGHMDEVAIFSRALSSSEISDIHTNGIQEAPTQVSMDALTLAGSAEGATLAPGAVQMAMDALSLASGAESATLSPGAVQMAMDALSLAGSAQGATLSPGAVQMAMDALSLAGSAEGATLVTPVELAMDALSLASGAESATLASGAIQLAMDALSLAGSAQSATLSPGTVELALDALSLAGSAQALLAVGGSIEVAMDALSLAGRAAELSITMGWPDVAVALSAATGLALSESAVTAAALSESAATGLALSESAVTAVALTKRTRV